MSSGQLATPWDCFEAIQTNFDSDEWRAKAVREKRPVVRITALWAGWGEIRGREPATKGKWQSVDHIMRSYQLCALAPGLLAVRSHGCWCQGCTSAILAGPAAGLRRASTEEAGCAGCVRASDPFYQWRDESCHQHEGAGVGANLQEVRRAGHRTASELVVGTWVLIEVRERTHDMGELWLGRCVAVAEWKQVVLPAGRKWTKEYGVRWDPGDWMVAVQLFSVNDDGEYFQDAPCIDIFNSSELRLAGFAATQSRGPRQVNTRSRRGDQAAHQAELEAEAAWCVPAEALLAAEGACREVAQAD